MKYLIWWFIWSYLPTFYLMSLKLMPQIFTLDGWGYNWAGPVPHIMWFLLIFSVNSLCFGVGTLFIIRWTTHYLN